MLGGRCCKLVSTSSTSVLHQKPVNWLACTKGVEIQLTGRLAVTGQNCHSFTAVLSAMIYDMDQRVPQDAFAHWLAGNGKAIGTIQTCLVQGI